MGDFSMKTKDEIYSQWIRAIWIFYLCVGIATAIIEIVVFLVLMIAGRIESTIPEYVIQFIVLPSAFIFGFIALSRILVTIIPEKLRPYIPVFAIQLGCFVVCLAHNVFPIIIVTYIVPMVLSIGFANKRFSFILLGTSYAFIVINAFLNFSWGRFESFDYLINYLLGILMFSMVAVISILYIKYDRDIRNSVDSSLRTKIILEERLMLDPLTELFNHEAFKKELGNQISLANSTGKFLSLAVIDIDHFKGVNDKYGHSKANDVLIGLSYKLKTLGEGTIVARYGGEEFAVIMPDKDVIEAYKLIENLRKEFAEISFETIEGIHVTLSAGISEYTFGKPESTFFEEADNAMYEAKNTGRNKVCLYEDEIFF